MESNEKDLICYKLLNEVFMDNAYASLQLNKKLSTIQAEKDRAYISSLFYGVLEKNVQLDYIISKLVTKKPKTSVAVLLKMGIYRLRFTSQPSYASINETVELAKKAGKGGISGFINAVLRKSQDFVLPEENSISQDEYLSVTYCVPSWIVQKLIEQYGYDFTKQFLAYEAPKKTHIRLNSRVTTKSDFEQKLSGFEYSKSKLGYYVAHDALKSLNKSSFTPQSLASMIAVNCYLPLDLKAPIVLDLCGAPGGKSIYLEELCPSATVYCCDLYPHRVELIKKYASRMKSNIKPTLSDATAICPEWLNFCDVVICDVPCSGLGVFKSKPDILFNKKPSDVESIKKIQYNILDNAKNYVKVGGALCYSTCTIFSEENEDNIYEFLDKNPNFVLDKIESPLARDNNGMVKLFPHTHDGSDGFFVARLRRLR